MLRLKGGQLQQIGLGPVSGLFSFSGPNKVICTVYLILAFEFEVIDTHLGEKSVAFHHKEKNKNYAYYYVNLYCYMYKRSLFAQIC